MKEQVATDAHTPPQNTVLAICVSLSSILRSCVGKNPQLANDLMPSLHRWPNAGGVGNLGEVWRASVSVPR